MIKQFTLNSLLSVSALLLFLPIPRTLANQSVPTTSLNLNLVTQSELNLKPSLQLSLKNDNYPKQISAKKFNAGLDILLKAGFFNSNEKHALKGTTVSFCRAANLLGDAQGTIDISWRTLPEAQRKGSRALAQAAQTMGLPLSAVSKSEYVGGSCPATN